MGKRQAWMGKSCVATARVGRYPETVTKPPTREEAARYMKRAEEVFRWLTNLL